MKKFIKLLLFLAVLCFGLSYAVKNTGAGIKSLHAAAQLDNPLLVKALVILGASVGWSYWGTLGMILGVVLAMVLFGITLLV